MISLDECSGSCNALSLKICVPKETKDINVQVFIMITNKNEAKTMKKHISCDCNYSFISTTCNSNQKQNKKTYQCECQNYCKCKKDYNWNPSSCICENSKYLKRIANTSVIEFFEIISVVDIVSTIKTSTIATNVTSTMLTNSDDKKVRQYFIWTQYYL